jgi:hypothetical protein
MPAEITAGRRRLLGSAALAVGAVSGAQRTTAALERLLVRARAAGVIRADTRRRISRLSSRCSAPSPAWPSPACRTATSASSWPGCAPGPDPLPGQPPTAEWLHQVAATKG